jgi:hypothetical protein
MPFYRYALHAVAGGIPGIGKNFKAKSAGSV